MNVTFTGIWDRDHSAAAVGREWGSRGLEGTRAGMEGACERSW